jgi:predicted glycoside hydrolase/deacetylase ChbG (UPF0249 family)
MMNLIFKYFSPMKKTNFLFAFLGLLMIPLFLNGQEMKTITEKLGYPEGTKLLIVHADDMGLAHSANMATIEALEKKGVSSGSIMVPCPWFPEIADFAKNHPEYDIGIHLTLTAEWEQYKWDGVLPSSEIPSLINENGFFYSSVEEVLQHADPVEVEREIRAQINRAVAFGVKPTHLDNHMGPLFVNKELLKIYLKVGKEYNLPVLLPSNYMALYGDDIKEYAGENQVFPFGYMKMENAPADEWNDFYNQVLENIKPGLNELIVHLAFDNAEMQAIAVGHPDYGSQWRQNDLNYLVSDEFKRMIEKNDIRLVEWREIKEVLYPENP